MNSLGRLLDVALSVIMVLAVILLFAATKARVEVVERNKIERITLASIATKHSFEQQTDHLDLQIQRARKWIEGIDDPQKAHLDFIEHFSPILESEGLIKTIRLTLEDGAQVLLTEQNGTNWSFASANAKDRSVESLFSKQGKLIEESGEIDSLLIKDSRGKKWFGKALNHAGKTTWTLEAGKQRSVRLVGSALKTAADSSSHLAVVAFEIDAAILVSNIRKVPSRIEGISAVRFPDGTIVYPSGEEENQELQNICQKAVKLQDQNIYTRIFDLESDELFYKAALHSIALTGLEPDIITIVPQNENSFFTAVNKYIISGLSLVLLLGALLFLGWYKSRVDARKLMMHEERSKNQQRKLKQVIGEREVLDREVHHRVKNNLQIISSLLNMQLLKLPEDAELIDTFRSNKKRIESLGALHTALYTSKDLRGIDLQEFFKSLSQWAKSEFTPPGVHISCDVNANGIKTDMDTARDIGMIVTELMVNAYQHAFPHATGGHIDVVLKHDKRNRYKLTVYDNGVGMGADLLELKNSSKMGLDIVDSLVEGLEGTFSYHSENGVKCEALIRIVPRERSDRPI